jgi:hypothetical protein
MQSAQLPWGWSDLLDPSRWLDLAERLVTSDFPQIFSSFGIVAALWLASYQWSVTRRHGAFSESFERKAASNGIIMGNAGPLGPFIRAARTESAEADEKKEERKIVQDVFVYMELDNLEYVFEKYRDREISARSTLRQCFIFVSRCKVPEFRDKAWDSAKLGYYRPEFRDAVWNLALFSQTKEVTVPHSNLLQRFVRKVKDAVSRWRSVSVETTGAPEK